MTCATMYHKFAIHTLSHAQIGKLLNGHRIRVKHGKGHEIHTSEEQHKTIIIKVVQLLFNSTNIKFKIINI